MCTDTYMDGTSHLRHCMVMCAVFHFSLSCSTRGRQTSTDESVNLSIMHQVNTLDNFRKLLFIIYVLSVLCCEAMTYNPDGLPAAYPLLSSFMGYIIAFRII